MATLTNSSRMHEIDERVWSKRSAASGDVAHKSPKQHCSTGGSRRRKTIHSACPVRCREMKPAAGPVRRSASSVAMPPRRRLSGESLDRTAPCPSRLERRRQQRAHRSSLSQRCTPIMPRGCPRASSPTARDPPYTRSSRLSKRPVISATTTADTAKTSASNSMHSTKKCRSQRTRRSTQSVLYTPLQGGNAQQSTEDSFTTPSAASTTRRSTTVDPMAPQHCCSMMAPSAESFPVSARASLDGATRAATVFSTALAADEEAFFRRLYGSISTEEGGKTSHFVVRTSTADVDTVAGDDADEGEDCVVVADPASEGDVDEENWQFTDPSPGDVEEPTATQVLCTPARQMVHHHRHVVSSSEVPSTPAVSEPGTMLFKDRRYCAGRADDSYRYSHSLCGPTSYHTEQRGCTWASLQADDPLPSCAAPLSSSGCVDFLVQASEDAHPAGLHHSHPDSWLFSCEDMKMVPTVVYSSRTPVVRLRKMSSDGSFLPGSSHEKDALERSGKSSEAVAHISTRFYSETHSEDSHMKQVMECRMDAAVACAMAAYPASAVAVCEDCSPPHLPFGAADVQVPAQEAETVEDIASWVHVLLRYRDRQNAYPMDESSASLFSVPSRELFSPAVENLRAVIADKKFRHAESTKNVSAFSPLFTRW